MIWSDTVGLGISIQVVRRGYVRRSDAGPAAPEKVN